MRVNRPVASLGVIALLLASCGGGGGGNPGTGTGTTQPAPLSISSGSSASVPENSTGTVYQITTNGGTGTVTYSLLQNSGDAALFNLSASGALTFKTPPDFERPGSRAQSNTYTVTVSASDGANGPSQQVTITVTNTVDIGVEQVSTIGGVHIAPVPGQARVFVTQSNGNIYLVDPAAPTQSTLYLSLAGTAGLRQITSVAAAPDFATSGTLYVFVVTANTFEIRKYGRTAAGTGNIASEDVILRVAYSNPASENLGGWLGFGADSLLYATVGNGLRAVFPGSSTPTQPNTSLLGKVLRIDPSRDDFTADTLRDYAIPSANPFASGGGAAEVYANGFGDPRTAGFDGANLYVADQVHADVQAASPLYLIRPADAGLTFGQGVPPVLFASETLSSTGTIVAGPVYRGPATPLVGQYFYRATGAITPNAYSGTYFIPAAALVQGTSQNARNGQLFNDTRTVAFGEDQSRNLYYTDGSVLFAILYR